MKNIIIELASSPELKRLSAADPEDFEKFADTLLVNQTGIRIDKNFPPVAIPTADAPAFLAEDDVYDNVEELDDPRYVSYLIRGSAEEDDVVRLQADTPKLPMVKGVYSDPTVEPCITCISTPAVGDERSVRRLLCSNELWQKGMNGSGVLLAIVDTGINLPYLRGKGLTNLVLDASRSWRPRSAPNVQPGQWPVGHGTMVSFDAALAAPRATLLDFALLQSRANSSSAFLSDAVVAYRKLIDIMRAPRRPGELRSMVVNNSWGMFHPSWDLPVGNTGNYSDNPRHPFNRIVKTLERTGADIVFAAGNCGRDCPDGRCRSVTDRTIYGANGHDKVICVAGVDTRGSRVGYSAIGPARLGANKPDIAGFTHFRGSGVYSADAGTSAASPVVAGVVTALRTKLPFDAANPNSVPSKVRDLLRTTALDRGAAGFDYEYGYGIINGCALSRRLAPLIADATFEGLLTLMRGDMPADDVEITNRTEPQEAAHPDCGCGRRL